ncbi:Proteinaceous RNase P 1-chloroplastic/mitochondrial [Striga hermonthica]|uniref:ribonuclease P n=1 Tax=Striga hermonthica TaxID=68872 RepID=A0A9N7RMZ9_STRHE|nr:Proteinaceous RNase P 1-chloroplastic/mitochondrial [Striga hermonthica]
MLFRVASLSPNKTSFILSCFSRTTDSLFFHSKRFNNLQRNYVWFTVKHIDTNQPKNPISMAIKATHNYSTTSAQALVQEPPNSGTRRSRKKARPTFTNVSRLAAAKKDPQLAFDLVRQMKDQGIAPKLRSYGPALFEFCGKGLADKAYEVDSHMKECGVSPEETELCALLRVSSETEREGKVYEMMHRLRSTVRQVSEETAAVVEDWFRSNKAARVGNEKWDASKVREGVLDGGGGWHGQGWLGKGSWRVMRTSMDERGVCRSCGERLVCIDIDPEETENFAKSLSKLACQKEAGTNFVKFQEWLRQRGPFDAVIDGANLGFANQHKFSFPEIARVVNQMRQISPSKKLPLVVLHQSRHPNNKKLLESWKKAGALYATPQGSNDDWYWLYAAVNSKCLLVTNDEMRDHLFNLLGNNFFPRWKEKHQVRIKPSLKGLLTLRMPPPYSLVIQESEQGSWHIPTVTGDDLETPRQWICATRIRQQGHLGQAEEERSLEHLKHEITYGSGQDMEHGGGDEERYVRHPIGQKATKAGKKKGKCGIWSSSSDKKAERMLDAFGHIMEIHRGVARIKNRPGLV